MWSQLFSNVFLSSKFSPKLLCLEKFPERIIKNSSRLHRESISQRRNNRHTEENRTGQKREGARRGSDAGRHTQGWNGTNPASQKNKRNTQKMVSSSLFCRCCLDLCSPTSAFKAPAGGDALSPAHRLLHSLPASLSSARITLQTHFPYAACFKSFAVRLQVLCVRVCVTWMKGISIQNTAHLLWG